MHKNFIFDFGQVLVHFLPLQMTAAYISDPEDCKLVCDVIFDRLYWDKLDDGTITDQELKAAACARLPQHLRQVACRVYDGWVEQLPFIEGMPPLVRDLKAAGGKLYLLSNISEGFTRQYKQVPRLVELFSLFDGLVFSGPLGMTKPGKEIFNHLLNTYGLQPEECVFIDDAPRNIAGAEAVGIKGYLFDGDAQKLKTTLLK